MRARFNVFGILTQLLPPQNHTQGPNFCTLQPLLAYQEFIFFVLMLVTGPRSQGPNFCTLLTIFFSSTGAKLFGLSKF